jgi:hypothetical protein
MFRKKMSGQKKNLDKELLDQLLQHHEFSDDDEFDPCTQVLGEFVCCDNIKRNRLMQDYNATHLGVLDQEEKSIKP